MKKSLIMTALLGASLLLCAPLALAHDLWLNPDNARPNVGDAVKVDIGFGHGYPADRAGEPLKEGMQIDVTAVGPDGQAVAVQSPSAGSRQLTVDKPGAYMVQAQTKPGFFCRTKDGMRRGDKKQNPGATKCMSFTMCANAPLVAGPGGGEFVMAADQALQIQPLADLATVKKGDALPVRVLFEGKPLAEAKVVATYAGYKPQPPAGAAAPPKDSKPLSRREAARQKAMQKTAVHFPVEVKTDAQGQATLKLDQAGWWLVLVGHATPYADPSVCDENMYKTSFTFNVN